jgi:hypothetical protein
MQNQVGGVDSKPQIKSAAFNNVGLMTPAVLQKVYMNQFLSMNPNYMNNLKKSLEILSSAKGENIDINQIQQLNQQPTADTVNKEETAPVQEPVEVQTNNLEDQNKIEEEEQEQVQEQEQEQEQEQVQEVSPVPETNGVQKVNVEEIKEIEEEEDDDEEEQLMRKMYEKMQKGLSEEREILEGPKPDPNAHYFYFSPTKKSSDKQEEEPTKIEIQEISPVIKSPKDKKKPRIEFDKSDNEDTSQILEKKLSSRTTQLIESKLAQKEKTVSREMLKNSLLKSKTKKQKKVEISKELLKNMTKIAKKIPKNKKELFKLEFKYDLLEKVISFYN